MKPAIFLFSLFPALLYGQIIDTTQKEYVIFKNGKKTEIEITDTDGKVIEVITPDGKKNKIQKSALESWHSNTLYDIPFKYNEDGKIEYSEVVEVPNVAEDELYNRARRMYATTFEDSKEVLEMEDREAGDLIGTGWIKIPFTKVIYSDWAEFWMTIEIQVKDGKYKYIISDLIIRHPYDPSIKQGYQNNEKQTVEKYYPTDFNFNSGMHKGIKAGMMLSLQNMIDNIKKSMAGEKKTKDW